MYHIGGPRAWNLISSGARCLTSPSHMTRNLLLIWLALLVGAPVAAYFLAGETEVVVSVKSGAVWAEVHGTRLDVPGRRGI